MYSLNVPVPRRVSALARDLARDLPRARARDRDEQTLVAKRLEAGDRRDYQRLAARTRDLLAGTPVFEARLDGIGVFADPTSGTAPVVYLGVESPGLEQLHARLVDELGAVDGVEGEDYVPHVTIARGGSERAARRLANRSIEPVEWTVSEVTFWDAERHQSTGTVSLPA